jgi:hypothetical protein
VRLFPFSLGFEVGPGCCGVDVRLQPRRNEQVADDPSRRVTSGGGARVWRDRRRWYSISGRVATVYGGVGGVPVEASIAEISPVAARGGGGLRGRGCGGFFKAAVGSSRSFLSDAASCIGCTKYNALGWAKSCAPIFLRIC